MVLTYSINELIFAKRFVLRTVLLLILAICYSFYEVRKMVPDAFLESDKEIPKKVNEEETMKVKSCKSLFTIDKGGDDVIWDTDDEYKKLSLKVPSLLEELQPSDGTQSIYKGSPETRLHLANGKLPYIPCKVVEYNVNSFRQCCGARKKSGKNNWVAFLGDSIARQKTLKFLSFLPQDLKYYYFLGDKEVTKQDMYLALQFPRWRPPTFDIFGVLPSEERHSSVGVPYSQKYARRKTDKSYPTNLKASYSIHPNNTLKEPAPNFGASPQLSSSHSNISYFEYLEPLDIRTTKHKPSRTKEIEFNYSKENLHKTNNPHKSYEIRLTMVWAPSGWENMRVVEEWINGESYPDIITISFGMWLALLENMDGFDSLLSLAEMEWKSKRIVQSVSKLAAKTNVLLWGLSRTKWFIHEEKRKAPARTSKKQYWNDIIQLSKLRYGISLLASVLWRRLRDTGAWLWDSALPLHFANMRECETLSNAGDYDNPFYQGEWWMCRDNVHPSYETNSNEMMMLVNFLCNKYVAKDHDNCCAEDKAQ